MNLPYVGQMCIYMTEYSKKQRYYSNVINRLLFGRNEAEEQTIVGEEEGRPMCLIFQVVN